MSAQDEVEKVLRSLHVMLSKSEPAPGEPGKVVVDKQRMIELLGELNKGIYEIKDEYELTTQSRDRAERDFKKQGEEIVRNANRKAEDIYAASVMYTDEVLNHVQSIMQVSASAIDTICEEFQKKIKTEQETIRENQLELKSQLQDLVDTDKYLKLIEDRNREIEREKARKEGKAAQDSDASIYANRRTEVRVNTEYLEKLGLSAEVPEEAPAAKGKELLAEEPYDEEDGFSIVNLASDDAEPDGGQEPEGIHRMWKNLTSGKR